MDSDPTRQPTTRRTTIERETTSVSLSQAESTVARLRGDGWKIAKAELEGDDFVIVAEREASMPVTQARHGKATREPTMGERLRQARIDAGLTARQVAHNAGLAAPFISNVETGRREPEPHTVWTICVGIGCDPHAFDDRYRSLDADDIAGYRERLQSAAAERAKQSKKPKGKES